MLSGQRQSRAAWLLSLFTVCLAVAGAAGWVCPRLAPATSSLSSSSRGGVRSLLAAKKGFGSSPPPPPSSGRGGGRGTNSSSSQQGEVRKIVSPRADDLEDSEVAISGADAFKQMQEERLKRDEEQRERIEELRAGRDATKLDPKAGVIPEVVANRMISRMAPFFGLPVLTGIGLFVFYFVLAKKYEMSFQPSVVAYSTQAPFAISLVGITYAILSASWDPEREGSFLGGDEFKKNIGSILDGLRDSKERQKLDDAVRERNRSERRRMKKEKWDDDEGY